MALQKLLPGAPKICSLLLMLVIPGFMVACGGGGGGNGEITIRLSWAPNQEMDMVGGYMVYAGSSVGTTNKLVAVVPITTPGFDPASPSIEYKASNDLGLVRGDNVCFRFKAYTSVGDSAFSDVTCITI